MFSHGNDSDLVLHCLRGGEHHHCLHQYVAQRLTAQQESRHTFSSSGLDETMYLKVIDDWSPCIILLLGHSGGFAEWNELIHETLPIDDVPSEILLEILGLAESIQ